MVDALAGRITPSSKLERPTLPRKEAALRRLTRSDVAMLSQAQMQLWSACETGDIAAVRRCLEEGASVDDRNRHGWSALHRACMGGNPECVKLVLPSDPQLSGQMLRSPDIDGNAPLHMAAGCGHSAIVKLLMSSGAAPDLRKQTEDGPKEDGATPMHTACKALADASEPQRQERLLETIVALLSGGALLEAKDERGRMAAAFLPQSMQTRLLERVRAAAGAAPEGDDADGRSDCACRAGAQPSTPSDVSLMERSCS